MIFFTCIYRLTFPMKSWPNTSIDQLLTVNHFVNCDKEGQNNQFWNEHDIKK